VLRRLGGLRPAAGVVGIGGQGVCVAAAECVGAPGASSCHGGSWSALLDMPSFLICQLHHVYL
jgi:hypothetical protein